MYKDNKPILNEDQIDLRLFFKTIWNKRKFICIFTLCFTTIVFFYQMSQKSVDIFVGTLLVEIGEIKTGKLMVPIDNPYNLKYVLELEELGTEIMIPNKSDKLIMIQVKNKDEEIIYKKVNAVYQKLINRQSEKLKMYSEYLPTNKVGNIEITKMSTNNKSFLLVAFSASFLCAILIVTFSRIIKNQKDEL